MDIKYIYFELYSEPTQGEKQEISIKNENVLMFKPHTNSSGIWGFTNLTKSFRYKSKESYTKVDQNWIDLTKYKSFDANFDKLVDDVLIKLNIKLRGTKIKKINERAES